MPCVIVDLKHGVRALWVPWAAIRARKHLSLSLQEKAEEVYRLYQNSPLSSHPVVALSELSTLCAGSCLDERTFYLVLLQLQKEKRVTVLEQNGEKVWKLAVPSLPRRALVQCVLTCLPASLPVDFSAFGVGAAVICPCPSDCEVCPGPTCQGLSCQRRRCRGLPADAERTAAVMQGGILIPGSREVTPPELSTPDLHPGP